MAVSTPSKHAYYRDREMLPQLAARYYREFGGARTVLDVGCGTGGFGRFRPSPAVAVYGLDMDAGAVAQAHRHETAVCLDLDREPLPYDDATFDAALAKDIFEHVQDPGRLAREIHRVLRPGGVLIASVVMAKPHRVWDDYTHVRGFTRRSARMLIEDAGFVVRAIWKMGGVPLTGRLRLLPFVPALLTLPPCDWLWASSWEVKALKCADGDG